MAEVVVVMHGIIGNTGEGWDAKLLLLFLLGILWIVSTATVELIKGVG